MKEFKIKQELVNKILNSLARRPYSEVATLIGEIERGLVLIENEKESKDDKEKETEK